MTYTESEIKEISVKLFELLKTNPLNFVMLLSEHDDNGSDFHKTVLLTYFNEQDFTDVYLNMDSENKLLVGGFIENRFSFLTIHKYPEIKEEVFWLREVFYLVDAQYNELQDDDELTLIDETFLEPINDILQRIHLPMVD